MLGIIPRSSERTTSALNYRAHVYILKKKKNLERGWRDASAMMIAFFQKTSVEFAAPMLEARHRNSSFRDSVPSSSLWGYHAHTCTNPQALTCTKLKIKIKSFFKDFKLTAWKSNKIRTSRRRELKSREQTLLKWGMEKNNKTKNWLFGQINVTSKPLAILFKGKKKTQVTEIAEEGALFSSLQKQKGQ